MSRTWDILVIPKRGEIFRQQFSVRPEVVMVLWEAVATAGPTPDRRWWASLNPLLGRTDNRREVRFRLHLTPMGLAYVEAER